MLQKSILLQCLKREFACVAVTPGGLDGCFGFIVNAAVVNETAFPEAKAASKGEAEEKRVGR